MRREKGGIDLTKFMKNKVLPIGKRGIVRGNEIRGVDPGGGWDERRDRFRGNEWEEKESIWMDVWMADRWRRANRRSSRRRTSYRASFLTRQFRIFWSDEGIFS